MRPGQPVYEDFARAHVAEELAAHADSPVFLCLNATQSLTTAVACQFVGKALHILADWVREGDPGAVVAEVVRDAGLAVGRQPRLIAPSSHFRSYDTVGLPGAVRRLPAELRSGGDSAATSRHHRGLRSPSGPRRTSGGARVPTSRELS